MGVVAGARATRGRWRARHPDQIDRASCNSLSVAYNTVFKRHCGTSNFEFVASFKVVHVTADLDEIARLDWWHSIDLGNGVITPGKKSLDLLKREAAAYFHKTDLSGASFLDIGTWNGANAFEARRRGAARIVALDAPAWEKRGGRQTFELARRILRMEDIEALELDIFDFTLDRPGQFDVVLFAGVFYHLYDPIRGLQLVSKCAKNLLIVETHLDLMDVDRPALVFYPRNELNKDASNWWGPNAQCMIDLLRSNGFAKIKFVNHPVHWNRGIFHAWRS